LRDICVTKKKVNIELEVDTNVVNSGVNPFQKVIWLARAVDSWRIFPRVFITVYIFLLYEVVMWFMALDNPNMEQAGLVSVIVGAGAAWFGLYVNSKGDGKVDIVKPQQIIVPPKKSNDYDNSYEEYQRPSAPAYLPDDNRG